jgi:DNA polymerase-4
MRFMGGASSQQSDATTAPRDPVEFHVDLDAFYASVEQSENPELRGKPVIIGARPGQRGVVSACSYEARVFGIHSAMPISQAYRRCKDGVYLAPRMKRYQEISKQIMHVLREFSPSVTQISIDEASLDMAGTERLFGAPEVIARQIKQDVGRQFGITISIGIAPNRYLAKLASEADKPDGLLRIRPGEEVEFLDGLSLHNLWGLGQKMLERLDEVNIHSVTALRSYPEEALRTLVGAAAGSYLYRVSRGIDPGMYSQSPKSRSISSENTFEHDTRDRETIYRVLLDISHQVMSRMMDEGYGSKTIQVKLRFSDFSTFTRRRTIGHYVSSAEEVYRTAIELVEKRWGGAELIRLVGVGLGALERQAEPGQQALFEDIYDKKRRVEKTVLELQKKHKDAKVVKANLLNRKHRYSD